MVFLWRTVNLSVNKRYVFVKTCEDYCIERSFKDIIDNNNPQNFFDLFHNYLTFGVSSLNLKIHKDKYLRGAHLTHHMNQCFLVRLTRRCQLDSCALDVVV